MRDNKELSGGICYLVDVFVTGTIDSFGNDINNCRMCCTSIGIDDGNIIWCWLRNIFMYV